MSRGGRPKNQIKPEKACTQCGVIKPLSDYYKAHKTYDGRNPHCKKCDIERNYRYRAALREEVGAFKTEQGCQMCGIKGLPACCYDLHHRDPSTKEFDIGKNLASLRAERIWKEVAKCDVICANCHRILTWQESNEKWGREV